MDNFIEIHDGEMRVYATGTPRKLRVHGHMRNTKEFSWEVTETILTQTSDSFISFTTKGGTPYSWKQIGDGPHGHLITTRRVFGKWRTVYLSDDAYIEEL